MSDSSDMPHYLKKLYEFLQPEFPMAKIIAPLQVAGRPGAVGVMAVNPVIERGKSAPEYDQHVSLALDDVSELADDVALKEIADLMAACLRQRTLLSLHKPHRAARAA
jgi:hypothetical protein